MKQRCEMRLSPELLSDIDKAIANGEAKNRTELVEIAVYSYLGKTSKRMQAENNLVECTEQMKEIWGKYAQLIEKVASQRETTKSYDYNPNT